MARAADERIARARGGAAPARVPIGLKDLFSVKGLPVTASSRVLAGNVATGVDVTALGKRAQHVEIAGGQARQPEQRQPLRQRDELRLPPEPLAAARDPLGGAGPVDPLAQAQPELGLPAFGPIAIRPGAH
jgi:hypothetical protein